MEATEKIAKAIKEVHKGIITAPTAMAAERRTSRPTKIAFAGWNGIELKASPRRFEFLCFISKQLEDDIGRLAVLELLSKGVYGKINPGLLDVVS